MERNAHPPVSLLCRSYQNRLPENSKIQSVTLTSPLPPSQKPTGTKREPGVFCWCVPQIVRIITMCRASRFRGGWSAVKMFMNFRPITCAMCCAASHMRRLGAHTLTCDNKHGRKCSSSPPPPFHLLPEGSAGRAENKGARSCAALNGTKQKCVQMCAGR